ncbi:MAG TPA: hypothetical protein VFI17_03500 [Solirubrobacterales bacterium]|nr:hypothetical protein [Solirubrobacterales bacterium]
MTVVDQAENVGGVVSAARLRESFMRRRANASNEEEREALGDAIGTIEVRFPELEDLPAGGAERFARERGHGKGARSPSHEGRQRHRPPVKQKPKAKAKPRPKAGGGKTASSTKRSQSSRTSARRSTRVEDRIRSRGRRAYTETGIPAAGASVSRIAMSALGATVGLAAVYLLLTSAERHAGKEPPLLGLLVAVTGFLRRIVAPVDFFGPQMTQLNYAKAIANPTEAAAIAVKHPTKLQPLGVKPAEIGISPTPRPRVTHKRR